MSCSVRETYGVLGLCFSVVSSSHSVVQVRQAIYRLVQGALTPEPQPVQSLPVLADRVTRSSLFVEIPSLLEGLAVEATGGANSFEDQARNK